MGRIKTSRVKNISKEIFSKYQDRFSDNFSKNKKVLKEIAKIDSKKLTNIIAGYITKLKSHQKM